MKTILSIFIILISLNLYSQDYKRDIYSIVECSRDNTGKLICEEHDVEYEININTTLSWFFLFDKSFGTHEKIISMSIIRFNNVKNNEQWLYELITDDGRRFNISLDEKKGTLILFAIYGINDKRHRIESIVFRFKNPQSI